MAASRNMLINDLASSLQYFEIDPKLHLRDMGKRGEEKENGGSRKKREQGVDNLRKGWITCSNGS